MFRTGYILDRRADSFWFLGFPFLAIGIALACHEWFPAIALASIGLWITIPHHLATWLRTYGLREDWQRWKGPLIVGPLVVIGTTMVGLRLAPMTLLVLGLLWDHQHSPARRIFFSNTFFVSQCLFALPIPLEWGECSYLLRSFEYERSALHFDPGFACADLLRRCTHRGSAEPDRSMGRESGGAVGRRASRRWAVGRLHRRRTLRNCALG
jgi:hypothetical protein